jgi:hypothetical protein
VVWLSVFLRIWEGLHEKPFVRYVGQVADSDQTKLVIEVKGIPLNVLAAYLAGRERGDTETRWHELVPAYETLAANLG